MFSHAPLQVVTGVGTLQHLYCAFGTRRGALVGGTAPLHVHTVTASITHGHSLHVHTVTASMHIRFQPLSHMGARHHSIWKQPPHQRLGANSPLRHAPPARPRQRQIKARGGLPPRPASASLSQLAGRFQLASHTVLVFHVGTPGGASRRAAACHGCMWGGAGPVRKPHE